MERHVIWWSQNRGAWRRTGSRLGASFEALEKTYGSFEAYVKNGIGLTEKELEQFREKDLV